MVKIKSKEDTKMKKTMRFLSLAALALVGAVMTGCSNEDDFTVEPENKSNIVTLTTTVGIGGGAETRALAADGTKTFAAGETMAVIYKNTSGTTVKAVSAALTAGDIQSGNKTATFTFTLENPDKGQNVTYIYPAAMAGTTNVNYSALNSQDGTIDNISSNLDLATYSGAWDGASLPSATLTNQLAFLAVTLKDADGSNDITSRITEMTISDGTNTYTVSPSSLSTIYVAIQPTASANIDVTATDGSTDYTKSLTGKTYAAGNGYNVSWRMAPAAPPTLAQTMTTAGMTVKVKYNYYDDYNYDDQENYCLFASNGDGSYTFQSGDGPAGGDYDHAKDLGVEGGKLVFKQNMHEYIDSWWEDCGFSVTFDTSNNTYSEWRGEDAAKEYNPYFISVEVNGTTISLKITVANLTGISDGREWATIVDDNSDKIYIAGHFIKRFSDGAKLLQYNGGTWVEVTYYERYHSETDYKFEGDS